MFKVVLVTYKSGVIPLKSFDKREEADEYILKIAEEEQGIKTGYIEDTITGKREKIEDLK
jgi:hypothetical protein